MRKLLVVAVLGAVGVACGVPSGGDAGVDGGTAAPMRCAIAAECTGNAGAAACGERHLSCIDGWCRADCQPARTCSIDAGAACITCGATTTCSTFSGCIGRLASMSSLLVESASCAAWPDGGALAGTRLLLSTSASGCVSTLARSDTGVSEGQLTVLDDLSLLGVFPALGGGCLVGEGTAPRRWVVTCPACELVLSGG